MKDARGRVIYVGKAVSLRNRVRSYFQSGAERSPWIGQLLSRIRDFEFIITTTEKEALILEGNLVKMHRPRFNIRLRDDKKFPFLKLTLYEEFPALIETRTPKNDRSAYFGPFSNAKAMRDTVRLVKRLFGVRSGAIISENRRTGCPWRDTTQLLDRACLEYHIGCCTAPCVNAVSREEYMEQVRNARLFLEGRHTDIMDNLNARMADAADRLAFEEAARYRDQIQAVGQVVEKQQVVSVRKEDSDVIVAAIERGMTVIQMLIVRSGKLIGEQHYPLEILEGCDEEMILDAFVKQHYETASHVPRQILLPSRLADSVSISEWLTDKRGGPVSLHVPQRGNHRRMVDMAKENARQALRHLLANLEVERRLQYETLAQLQEKLGLERFPERIECFDISNVQGKHAVGSMVVMVDGQPQKKLYRRFRIKHTAESPDDYEMMREVLRRRFQRARESDEKFLPLPDLLIVDGGRGQLGCAVQVGSEFQLEGLPMAGLAKEYELLYVPGRSEPVTLPRNTPALHLVQRLRDEAHRFAVAFHRQQRSKSQVQSVLDEVPGVGEQRKKNLLRHFGSVKRMQMASVEELAGIPGMSNALAARLQEHLSRYV